MLRIEDGRLVRVASADVGSWGQGVVFNNEGNRIFVQNMVEREIQVLDFDGSALTTRPERVRIEGGPSALRTADR
jgi:hypothetical protein